MTLADMILVVVIAVLALSGFRRGLIVGVFSLIGLLAGAYIGARVVPGLIGLGGSRYLPLVTLASAVILAGICQSLGVMGGRTVRTALGIGPLRALDNLGGAVLGATIGIVLCWTVGAVLLYLPGQTELRRHAQESLILSSLNEILTPKDLIDALAGIDPFAAIAGPDAGVGVPDPTIVRDPDIVAARDGVVRIRGSSCGLGVEGSGWIVAPGLVVTNAHVVAGVHTPTVDRRSGRTWESTIVAFDERNDIAILRVPGLTGTVLPRTEPESGRAVVILGFPENGPYDLEPARLGRTIVTVGRDAYGKFPVTREVVTMRASVRPGNSGGPILDADGRVRATVFAQRAGSGGGYGVPTRFVDAALAEIGPKPLTPPCVK